MVPLAPCPDMRVSFLIHLCRDTGTSDIESCSQGAPIFAAECHRGQLFCRLGKRNDSGGKGADTCRGSTWGDRIIILPCEVLCVLQNEGGTKFCCSTDLFLVWCHPHWRSPVWFSLWQTGHASLTLSIQPEGECSVLHVTLPRLLLRHRHSGH